MINADSWQGVAAQLAHIGLPVLGRILGGKIPVIGGLFGGAVGESTGRIVAQAIATALGVKAEPKAVSRAIEQGATSDVVARLSAIESEAAARWPALAEIVKSDNASDLEMRRIDNEAFAMRFRAEVASNDPRATLYRTLVLWVASACLAWLFLLAVIGITFGGSVLANLIAAKDLLYWLLPGLAGLVLGHWWTRGKEREVALTAMTGPPPAAAAKR